MRGAGPDDRLYMETKHGSKGYKHESMGAAGYRKNHIQ